MEKSRMRRMVLKTEGFEIELERESFGTEMVMPELPQIMVGRAEALHPGLAAAPPPAPILAAQKGEEPPLAARSRFITSPMVGTFYQAPSPEDPPFVRVGDLVEEETVVCIIEAMKVMNEVKAGMRGTVAEVLMQSGDPVEFGTKIIRIET